MPHIRTDQFAPTYHLFLREATLARSSIVFGLNALRSAGVSERQGEFYTAAFQLSTAIERMLKLILILDFMASNAGSTPNQKQIKAYMHDLASLFHSCKAVAQRRGIIALDGLLPSSFEMRLLHVLSDFARDGRYFNLDAIGGHRSAQDILPRLETMYAECFRSEVPERRQRRVSDQAVFMGAVLGDSTMVALHDLSGSTMDLSQAAHSVGLYKETAPYMTRHAAVLLRGIISVLQSVGNVAQGTTVEGRKGRMDVPDFGEMVSFLPDDPVQLLRRRRWR